MKPVWLTPKAYCAEYTMHPTTLSRKLRSVKAPAFNYQLGGSVDSVRVVKFVLTAELHDFLQKRTPRI